MKEKQLGIFFLSLLISSFKKIFGLTDFYLNFNRGLSSILISYNRDPRKNVKDLLASFCDDVKNFNGRSSV